MTLIYLIFCVEKTTKKQIYKFQKRQTKPTAKAPLTLLRAVHFSARKETVDFSSIASHPAPEKGLA